MKNRVVVLLSVVLLFFVSPITEAAAMNLGNYGQEIPIKVMSYNIHAGIGLDENYDIDRIAETIAESGADIIGLQEVDVHWGARSNFDNEIRLLAEKLDMHAFFAPIYDQDPLNEGEPRRQYGLAVLSKYPIIKSINHDITRLSTQDAVPEPKLTPGFPEVLINVRGVQVSFYSTHLDYRADPVVREMQVADMLDIISAKENAILVGDMNASPNAPELQPLFNRFQDAWAVAGDGDGFTYPAPIANNRIDYIFTSPGMQLENTKVLYSEASDHLPVTTDITLKRR